MRKLGWRALLDGVHFDADAALLAAISVARSEEALRQAKLAEAAEVSRLLQGAELSPIASAVSELTGVTLLGLTPMCALHPASPQADPAQNASAESCAPGVPMFDINARVQRHKEETARLDELARLRARDEYRAGEQPVITAPEPIMSLRALIQAHKHEWPAIERDAKDASSNGLSAARAQGSRGWDESKALSWARSKGRLVPETGSAAALASLLSSLPSKRHRSK